MLETKDKNGINPIVMQLQELGFNKNYSKRVFQYLHPADLEEALNYMSKVHGIIQHRFIRGRSKIRNNKCYICGEKKEIHLEDFKISSRIEEDISEDQKEIDTVSIYINNIENSSSNGIIREFRGKNHPKINRINNPNVRIIPDKKHKKKKHSIKTVKKATIKSECPVCGEQFIVNENNKVKNCGHAFCNGCWYDFLSVKIKENKISSIKCLDYNCKEKLTDQFIKQLLNSDQDLIILYKRYKLELEIINDPKKKLCPYPNCDSYLEQNKKNKIVKCKHNHSYCFICLKKHKANSPCDNTLDKSIEDFTKNHFVKKCPGCGIITEKNNGCNHITCAKCGHQWCWLCNGNYGPNHYNEGRCRGFQFFQPKNDNDIRRIMEGKLRHNELSGSQRQYFDGINEQEDYEQINCCKKLLYTIIFILFGNCYFIPKGCNIFNNCFGVIIVIYGIINIALFFPMILINVITFLFILMSNGFRGFIINFEHLETLYAKKFVFIFINTLTGFLTLIYGYCWKELIDDRTHNINKPVTRFFAFLICAIFLNIAIFPLHLFINIILFIIVFIFDCSLRVLDDNFRHAYGFRIQNDI